MDRIKRLETIVENLNERVNLLEGRAPKRAEPVQERLDINDDALPF